MSNDVNAGDVVRLKSGGPHMTAVQVGEDQFGTMTVWCEWFDSKKAPQKETFSLAAVEKVPPSSGGNFQVRMTR